MGHLAAAWVLGLLLAPPQEQKETVSELRASEIVEWMSRHSDRKFAWSEGALKLKEKIVSFTPGLLDAGHAYEAGLSLLKSVDVAAIPAQDGSGAVRLFPAFSGGKETLQVHTSADQLPKADEMCSLQLKLTYTSPREVQATLINLASFPQGILSTESAGTILMTDYASKLRKMAELIRGIDVPRNPPMSTWKISIVALEGTAGDASLPEEFKALDLPKAAGKTRFVELGRSMMQYFDVRTEIFHPQGQKIPEVGLRILARQPLFARLSGSVSSEKGRFFIERFSVHQDPTDKEAPLLTTRLYLKEGDWTLVGSVSPEKDGASLVILARADREGK